MITLTITDGAQFQVKWQSGMNVQTAREEAFNSAAACTFTDALLYYGSQYGYLVSMFNETYETLIQKRLPFFIGNF